MTESAAPPDTQRIDKWLWCARFFKTRSLAGKAVSAGGFRLTRHDQTQRVSKPGFNVQPNDRIAFTRGERLFVVKVESCARRRAPASEAQTLYEDLSPPPPPKPDRVSSAGSGVREKGSGRPTKKERREIAKLRDEI